MRVIFMNNSFSKLLSIVIATVIVLSTFTTAFAVDNEEEVSTTESTVTTTEPVTESSDPTVTTPTDSTEPTEPTKPTINYSGVAGKNLRYYFNRNNGTLHISGIGTTMNNYSKKNLPPWHSFASNVKAVYVNKATNLTNIGSYMCADMINLQKIYYSKKLKSIGKCAFLNTKKLTALTLNRNISRINVDAFKGSKTPIIKVMNPSLSINFGGYTIPKTTKIQCYGTNTPIYKYARVNGNNVILMISSITLNTKKVVCKKKTTTVKAKLSPSIATNKKVKWFTTNKNIATVDSNGKVKAKKKGTCYVYCKSTDGSNKTSNKMKIIVTSFQLYQYIFTNNNCYKERTAIDPKGIVVHSTGENAPYLRTYVPAWNVPNPGGREVCVHAFLGKNSKGKLEVWQVLPFEMACWGVGGGPKGLYNYNPGYIQFECCEDSKYNRTYFNQVYDEATDFCAYLCLRYSLPYTKVTSHAGACAEGYGSAHGDIDHWLKIYGKNMNDFRNTVKKKIYKIDKNPDLKSGTKHKKIKAKSDMYVWSKDIVDEYGNSSKKLQKISKGREVTFLRDNFNGWSYVQISNKKGYVQNNLTNLAYGSKYVKKKVNYKGTYLYTKPCGNKYKVKFLSYNTRVQLVSTINKGKKKGYSYVCYKNKYYYVKTNTLY